MPNKKVLKYKDFIENDANEMGRGGFEMFGIGIHILLATLNRRDRRIWFVFESITS